MDGIAFAQACRAGVEIYERLRRSGVDVRDDGSLAAAFDDTFGSSGVDPAYAGAAWSALLGAHDEELLG